MHFQKILMKNYDALADLEIKGNLYSDEYQKIVLQIKLICDIIARKWRGIYLTGAENHRFGTSLLKGIGFSADFEPLFHLSNIDNQHKDVIRMLTDLYYYGVMNHQCFIDIEELKTSSNDDELSEEYNIEHNIEIADELNLFLITDHLFLEGLMREIEKETNTAKKNRFIQLKYDYIATSHSLENHLIKHPQNIVCIAYFEELMHVLMKRNMEDFETYCIEEAVDYIKLHLDYLSKMKELSEQTEFDAQYHMLYIRAMMSLISDEMWISEIHDYFEEVLKTNHTKLKK